MSLTVRTRPLSTYGTLQAPLAVEVDLSDIDPPKRQRQFQLGYEGIPSTNFFRFRAPRRIEMRVERIGSDRMLQNVAVALCDQRGRRISDLIPTQDGSSGYIVVEPGDYIVTVTLGSAIMVEVTLDFYFRPYRWRLAGEMVGEGFGLLTPYVTAYRAIGEGGGVATLQVNTTSTAELLAEGAGDGELEILFGGVGSGLTLMGEGASSASLEMTAVMFIDSRGRELREDWVVDPISSDRQITRGATMPFGVRMLDLNGDLVPLVGYTGSLEVWDEPHFNRYSVHALDTDRLALGYLETDVPAGTTANYPDVVYMEVFLEDNNGTGLSRTYPVQAIWTVVEGYSR